MGGLGVAVRLHLTRQMDFAILGQNAATLCMIVDAAVEVLAVVGGLGIPNTDVHS